MLPRRMRATRAMDSLRCARGGTGRSLATSTGRCRLGHGKLSGFLQRHGAKVDFPWSGSTTLVRLRGSAHDIRRCGEGRPGCAMAYWGVARTWYHPIWAPPSADELQQGAAALHQALAMDAK